MHVYIHTHTYIYANIHIYIQYTYCCMYIYRYMLKYTSLLPMTLEEHTRESLLNIHAKELQALRVARLTAIPGRGMS